MLVIPFAFVASGCFVTIADPAVNAVGPSKGGTGGGHAGGDAGAAGGTDGGGAGTNGSGGVQKDASPGACAACALPNVKVHGCGDGACTIVQCADGFVDCDGAPANGCETDFRVVPTDAMAGAQATQLSAKVDGDGAEWAGLPLYPMALPCTACRPDQPGGQNGAPIVGRHANAADLTAAFRLAWDESALYLFAEVLDDQIVAQDASNVELQDGIEVFIDGDPNDVNNQYGPDVHHLFIGVLARPGSNVEERNQQLRAGDVAAATNVEQRCYFAEMSFSWDYVMGRIPHTPKVGEVHGFTIATNDWDVPSRSEAGAQAVRETQLFWVVPGVNYSYETTGFGVVTLGN